MGSSKLLGNDTGRLEFSSHQVQPAQAAKHRISAHGTPGSTLLHHGTPAQRDWPRAHQHPSPLVTPLLLPAGTVALGLRDGAAPGPDQGSGKTLPQPSSGTR